MPFVPSVASPVGFIYTTTEVLKADGVILNTLAYNIDTLDGRGEVQGVIDAENKFSPGRDGSYWVPNKHFDEGYFTLSMWVRGANPDGTVPTLQSAKQLFFTNRDMLSRIFGKRWQLIHFEQTKPDGSIRECWGEVVTPYSFTHLGGPVQAARMSVEVKVPAAFWQEQVTRIPSTANGIGTNTLLSLAADFGDSTAPIKDAILMISGPVNNPMVTNYSTGAFVQWNGTVPTGQTLVIDCGGYTAKLNGVDATSKLTHGASIALLPIVPEANPQVMFTGSGTGAGTSLAVQAHRKYLMA